MNMHATLVTRSPEPPSSAFFELDTVPSAVAEHHSVVAVAAYYLAERRGFQPGHEIQDWLAAERQLGGDNVTQE